jgi:hypothetical protein
MPQSPTRKQSAASARNAEAARAARSARAAERRAASESEVTAAYAGVIAEVDGAAEAIVARNPKLAALRAGVALLELARVATSPHFDPQRSRSMASALRETRGLIDELMGARVR